jgi:hypothetical protein
MAAAAGILVSSFVLGCYTFVPAPASYITAGQPVSLEINDLGRVNLSPVIGADVARVTGTLVQQGTADYTIRMDEITYLNGKSSRWSGETVTIRQDFVRTVFQRKFSSGKTAAAVLAGAGLVTGAILSKNINGSGDSGGDTKPPPGGGTASRGHQ